MDHDTWMNTNHFDSVSFVSLFNNHFSKSKYHTSQGKIQTQTNDKVNLYFQYFNLLPTRKVICLHKVNGQLHLNLLTNQNASHACSGN